MADVASDLKTWSTTASSNSPADATVIGAGLADNFQEIQKVVRQDLAHKGADIASAATTDLGAVVGLMHDITGTVTITSFGTVSAGIWKIVKFEGALTLTHNATSLILPGGQNITTVNGDVGIFMSEGSGNWRCLAWLPTSNAPANQALTSGRVVYTTTGGKLTDSANLTFDGTTLTATSVTLTMGGTAANIALGSNFISNGGTDAGLSLDSSNNATISGTLAVNGANITTDDTTFAVFNTNATTINAFGAATTAINIGGAANDTTWTGQSFTLTGANSTDNTVLAVTNTSNAAAASHSYVDVSVGGTTSTGDPHMRLTIPGGTSWHVGVDNSNSDQLTIGTGTAVGTNPVLIASTSAFGVQSTSMSIPATANLYLDGGTNTFISEVGADIVQCTTGGTERWRTTAGGYFKASQTGGYANSTGAYHELKHTADSQIAQFTNSNASLTSTITGIDIVYSAAAPNGTAANFVYAEDTSAQRHGWRSNGGYANFSANNVNLCDAAVKDIRGDSDDHTNFVKGLQFKKTAYLDSNEAGQEFDDLVAQDIEALDPTLVTVFQPARDAIEATEDSPARPALQELKGSYYNRLQARINSVIPRLIARIEALEARP